MVILVGFGVLSAGGSSAGAKSVGSGWAISLR